MNEKKKIKRKSNEKKEKNEKLAKQRKGNRRRNEEFFCIDILLSELSRPFFFLGVSMSLLK